MHDCLEAGQRGPDVRGPRQPVGPDQVEGFLVVGAGLLVQRFDAGAYIAAVVAEPADRHRALDVVWLGEEGRTGGEGVRDQVRRHAMAGDDEEADLTAGAADQCRHDVSVGAVAGVQACDVDDGEVLHGEVLGVSGRIRRHLGRRQESNSPWRAA